MRYLFVFLAASLFAQSSYSRTPFASYLMLPADAREDALGSVVPSPTTNPAFAAGSASVVEAGVRYRWLGAVDNFIGGAYRLGRIVAFARIDLSGASEIEARDFPTQEPDYTFSAHRVNAAFGLGASVGGGVALGVMGRHIHERLHLEALDANTISAGISLRRGWANLWAAVTDYGESEAMAQALYPPPTTYRAGFIAQLPYADVGFSYTKPDRLKGCGVFAVEAKPVRTLFLRASYTVGHDTRTLACGAGFRWQRLRIDYAAALYGELGTNHSVSVSYSFGTSTGGPK